MMQATKQEKIDWQKIMADQSRSGLSQTAYCKQHGIDLAKFGYYRNKMQSSEKERVAKSPLFQPVTMTSHTNEEIKIFLPNGFRCEFTHATNVIQIKKIIEMLLTC